MAAFAQERSVVIDEPGGERAGMLSSDMRLQDSF
jgi:hypothetical protein